MNLLRLLSGLVAWAFRRRRPKEAVQVVRMEAVQVVRIIALPDMHRAHKHQGRPVAVPCQGKSCPLCDAKPPSKPSAGPPTKRSSAKSQRGRSPHRHGWYSVENDKALGHYYCALATGGTVMVTNVTISPTGGLAGWPDAVYVGEVVPTNEGGIQFSRYFALGETPSPRLVANSSRVSGRSSFKLASEPKTASTVC